MTSLGDDYSTALYTTLNGLFGGLDIGYEGPTDGSDWLEIQRITEAASTWLRNKSKQGTRIEVTLAFWGNNPITLAGRAKTLINSIQSTPPSVAGFEENKTRILMNESMPKLSTEGQNVQHGRIVRFTHEYVPA